MGPALEQSSYARVLHATLGPLSKGWQIYQLAVNYRGAPVDVGWRVLPSPDVADRYGIEQIPPLVADLAPDVVFVFNSFLGLPGYSGLPARLGERRPVLVAHCPVLGEPTDPRLVGRLSFFDCVVVLSERVRRHFSESMETCLRTGMIERVPRIEVIPHGLDAGLFRPLGDRSAARAGIPSLRGLPNDAFVVLNANRNLPRKRVDITVAGFAQFARDKPPHVKLYLHMGEAPDGVSLRSLIRELGVADRVILACDEAGAHPRLDDSSLNQLYNACDVGVNTASSEGFGMISFEHAATGAAQIVPGSWVCGDVWGDSAELLGAAREQSTTVRHTRETVVSSAGVAVALERLYADPIHRARMSERAAAHAGDPSFHWSTIAMRWDNLLRELSGLG